jgi:Zn finger protein HypA/HybF involved in hydrogenase expression
MENLPKIEEEMWCWHCEHYWKTDDYYECKECPNCKNEPTRFMRTSSTGFAYAWMAKHKLEERDNKIEGIIKEEKTDN